MKTEERRRARELQAEGWSIKEIERHLGVSRGSVSLWVRDVPLSPQQREALAARIRWGPVLSGERTAEAARAVRRTYQEDGRRRAREGDLLCAAGCMLYWAEGWKNRNKVSVVNSDPEVLTFFAAFLRRSFRVRSEAMRITCNLFADHLARQRAIEDLWLTRLELPRSSFRKSAVNRYSKYSQKKRTNELPYGTCALVVHRTRIVQTIYGSIQEYGGFERPGWLD